MIKQFQIKEVYLVHFLKLTHPLLVLGFSVTWSAAVTAEIYQWKDRQGRLHFTDSVVVYERALSQQPLGSVSNVKTVSTGPMNFMDAIPDSVIDQVPQRDADQEETRMTNKATQRVALQKQQQLECDALKRELYQLKATMKQGYGLDQAKHYKAKKLKLRQALWQQCR